MQSHDFQSLKAAAKAAGLKLTSQRVEIFREVSARRDHPDAEAIFAALKSRLPGLSLDTVYRTLWTLVDLGLISSLGPRGESRRFEGNKERHHHFICQRCGKVEDFTSAELDALRVPEGLSALGRVVNAQVEVHGICADCLRAEAEEGRAGNESMDKEQPLP